MKKKKIIIGALVVLALIVGIMASRHYFQKFYYVGTIEATRIDLSSRLASNVLSYHAKEGDSVTEGSPLVSLDCKDIEIQRAYANSSFERSEKLLKSGGLPREAFDLALKNKQEADLKQSWCEISAPISGKILSHFMDENEWVVPGTKLISLADLTKVWAYLYVEQAMLSKIKLGMQVEGYIPELSEKTFNGSIIKINQEAEFTPKNVQTREERSRLVFGVKVQFDNKDELLKPGMSIEVSLPQ